MLFNECQLSLLSNRFNLVRIHEKQTTRRQMVSLHTLVLLDTEAVIYPYCEGEVYLSNHKDIRRALHCLRFSAISSHRFCCSSVSMIIPGTSVGRSFSSSATITK